MKGPLNPNIVKTSANVMPTDADAEVLGYLHEHPKAMELVRYLKDAAFCYHELKIVLEKAREVSGDLKREKEEEQSKWLEEWIEDVKRCLEKYKDSWFQKEGMARPCLVWPDGRTLGIGWASHLSGDPGSFKRLGFDGYYDFYSLPKRKRNLFLKKGLAVFNRLFSKEDIENINKMPTPVLSTRQDLLK